MKKLISILILSIATSAHAISDSEIERLTGPDAEKRISQFKSSAKKYAKLDTEVEIDFDSFLSTDAKGFTTYNSFGLNKIRSTISKFSRKRIYLDDKIDLIVLRNVINPEGKDIAHEGTTVTLTCAFHIGKEGCFTNDEFHSFFEGVSQKTTKPKVEIVEEIQSGAIISEVKEEPTVYIDPLTFEMKQTESANIEPTQEAIEAIAQDIIEAPTEILE